MKVDTSHNILCYMTPRKLQYQSVDLCINVTKQSTNLTVEMGKWARYVKKCKFWDAIPEKLAVDIIISPNLRLS